MFIKNINIANPLILYFVETFGFILQVNIYTTLFNLKDSVFLCSIRYTISLILAYLTALLAAKCSIILLLNGREYLCKGFVCLGISQGAVV